MKRHIGFSLMVLAVLIAGFGASRAEAAQDEARALPTLLMHNSYSQEFETEADPFSGRSLLSEEKTTEPMQRMLFLLNSKSPNMPLEEFLSSHPTEQQRVQALKDLEGQ